MLGEPGVKGGRGRHGALPPDLSGRQDGAVEAAGRMMLAGAMP
jgi:hypothetical protein